MGISWKTHKAENLVSFSIFGQSSLLETVDALRELAAAPDFSPAMRRLYVCDDDLTAASGLDSTQGAFVDVLGHQIARMFDHPATVAYVRHRDNTVAIDRFAATVRVCNEVYARDGKSPVDLKEFEDLAEAIAWLGLPPGFRP
ncbi:MAG: hypothetical protein CMM77_05220 [Rhodospirillaceae bacterium]|jgi:hypothetical protein|nr:hypothetical protein [Magnetovibrio sp.]MAY66508.1 hypothetical protein [Rhodospirillaceae bacterium]|tara:strand:- start:277 stop:705 length:429 start_codon:yes stop_codon:yes gene_type:complete